MATPADSSVQNQALLPPPAALVVGQHSYTAHGSVGPAIAVVVVIAVLGVVAGLIGRICAGRSVMGYGHFDVEAWMDTKFSSCIDGHVDPLPPLRYRPNPPEEAPATAPAAEAEAVEPVEAKEEGEEDKNENSHDEHSHS